MNGHHHGATRWLDIVQQIIAILVDVFRFGDDQLRSSLHIKEVTEDDYNVLYECWMANQEGYNKSLVQFKRGSKCNLSPVSFVAMLAKLFCIS